MTDEGDGAATTLRDALLGKGSFAMSPSMLKLVQSINQMHETEEDRASRMADAVENMPAVRTARAAQATAEAVQALLDQAIVSDRRDRQTLFWTRVSVLVVAILGIAGIVVTLLVA